MGMSDVKISLSKMYANISSREESTENVIALIRIAHEALQLMKLGTSVEAKKGGDKKYAAWKENYLQQRMWLKTILERVTE